VELENQAKDKNAVYSAKALVRSMLKDPSSGEFSHEFAWMKNGHETACGDVNAKNSFGAMTGDQGWIVVPDRNVAMIRSFDNGDEFDREWNRDCTGVEDRAAPPPKEFAGVKIGAPVPATLQTFQDSKEVLTPKTPGPADYLGVRLDKTWFTKDGSRVDSGAGTAKGGFAKLSEAMVHAYGAPSTDTADANRLVTWQWPTVKLTLQNSDDRNEATVTVLQHAKGE
jgi:hypothetical protein